MPPIYLFLALLAFICYYVMSKRLRRRLPPGPTALPLIGNTHHFLIGKLKGKSNVDVMREWKAKYGNVYTLWLGPMPTVLVCDHQTMVDAFLKHGDAHAGRLSTFMVNKVREGFMGIIFSEGPEWQEQRRFALHTLRNFGFGRNLMQQKILEEAELRFSALDKEIESSKDGTVTIISAPFFDLLIGSILNKLLAGYRYDETNQDEFLALKHNIDTASAQFTMLDFVMFNEFTCQLPLFKKRWESITKPLTDVRDLMKKQIKDRLESIASGQYILDLHGEGEDFIDAYLIEMERRKQNSQDMGSFSDDNLVSNLVDLWGAGMDTTVSTLLWTFVYLLNYPDVQERVRNEVLAVTGGNRNAELNDKSSLPYLCAVVTEAMRCSNILNFSVPHKTLAETVAGDYVVPKGTVVIGQQCVVMSDEDSFRDAHKFNPDRYLDDKSAEKNVIPFGVGKRSCLGESLARAELFLIIANLLQRYKISVPSGTNPPSLQELEPMAATRRSEPYEMTLTQVAK